MPGSFYFSYIQNRNAHKIFYKVLIYILCTPSPNPTIWYNNQQKENHFYRKYPIKYKRDEEFRWAKFRSRFFHQDTKNPIHIQVYIFYLWCSVCVCCVEFLSAPDSHKEIIYRNINFKSFRIFLCASRNIYSFYISMGYRSWDGEAVK